ncbi:MAG: tRNA 5-methoxyuridine(34)/uridine 5-oxyacetic acid(34) synthase CmoB [Rhodothermales bacterium]
MIDYTSLYEQLAISPLESWLDVLPSQLQNAFDSKRNGDLDLWLLTLKELPQVQASSYDLNANVVRVGTSDDISKNHKDQLTESLQVLHPWRKGPFDLFGIHVDTEWRSDMKWERLADAIEPLAGRRVLDIGCGSGYHCWRMLGADARLVVGIDPYLLFVMQYQAVRSFIGDVPAYVLPIGVEALPENLVGFDTVFSMGVLYHRRSPFDHLLKLKELLRVGGELVLETLVIEGNEDAILVPEDRYAKMRNVWFLPSPAGLARWLKRCGFKDVQLVDVSPTTNEEQRATPWMRFESLQDYLNPEDPTLTMEGYPAPRRAILTAKR